MARTHASQLQFNSFPQDNLLWKIDWVAEPLLITTSRSAPTVKLYLSKVRNEKYIDTLDHTLKTNYCQIRVGISHLSLFNIGSTWKNGLKQADSVDPRKFIMKVNTATAHVIPFEEVMHNDLSPVLSKINYPVGQSSYSRLHKSPLIAFTYNNNPTGLLIPAIEVVRFYYIISSRLSLATFYGDIPKLIHEIPRFDIETKTVYMAIKRAVTYKEAYLLGRFWSSEVMRRGAEAIHAWVMKSCNNYKDGMSPSTFFPFEGQTELIFNGIKVNCADGVPRYLCTKIRDCSGLINYKKIVLSKERVAQGDEDEDEDELDSVIKSYWPLYETESNDLIESNDEASSDNLAKEYYEDEVRFSDLNNKELIVHTTNVAGETESFKYIGAGGKKTQLTSGEAGAGRKDQRQATVSSNMKTEEPRFDYGPERYQEFLKILRDLRDKGLEVETLGLYIPKDIKVDKHHGPINIYSAGNDKAVGCFQTIAKRNSWLTRPGGEIPRALFIVEVKCKDKYWYLLELEKFESEVNSTHSLLILYFPDNRKMYNKSLYEYVSACCEYKGWAPLKGDFAKFRKYNFAHTSNLKQRVIDIVTG